MHRTSFDQMKLFIDEYLNKESCLKILDVGSYNVGRRNGTYKLLVDNENWHYTGGDIEAGPNVDVVFDSPYDWGIISNTYDVVISGQCIEHVQDVQLWAKECIRVLKPGGLMCIIGPWRWNEHRFPYDCWRILPDGMNWLLGTFGKMEIIKTFLSATDTIGIARKPIK